MTEVALRLPEAVARRLEDGGRDLERRVLEALAVDAYRCGDLTSFEVQELLGLASRWETEEFMKEHQAYLHYDEADLDADIDAIRRVTAA